MNAKFERRALQLTVSVVTMLPIYAGLRGAIEGLEGLSPGTANAPDLASHGRYLSGLLLGIGLAFLAMVPTIERQGSAFRLLTGIVFLGGLARLGALLAFGLPSPGMILGLLVELVVTPLLALWRERVQRRPASTQI